MKLKTGTVVFKGDRLKALMKDYHLAEFDDESHELVPVTYNGKRIPSRLSFRALSKAVLGNETNESTIRESCRRNVISVDLLSEICSYLHISPDYLQGINDQNYSSLQTYCQTSRAHVDITDLKELADDPLPELMSTYERRKQAYSQAHVLDKNNILMVDSSYNLGLLSVPANTVDMPVYSSFIPFINDLLNTPMYAQYKDMSEWQGYLDMVLSDLMFNDKEESLNQIIENVQRKAVSGDYYTYERIYRENPKLHQTSKEEGKDNGKD